MARCPTCGRNMDTLPEFRVGDKVRHMNGGQGVVTDVGPLRGEDCVVVDFGKWKGAYDAFWFRSHPTGLTKVCGNHNDSR